MHLYSALKSWYYVEPHVEMLALLQLHISTEIVAYSLLENSSILDIFSVKNLKTSIFKPWHRFSIGFWSELSELLASLAFLVGTISQSCFHLTRAFTLFVVTITKPVPYNMIFYDLSKMVYFFWGFNKDQVLTNRWQIPPPELWISASLSKLPRAWLLFLNKGLISLVVMF